MTEYKENVWYGWNGGECPVHPEAIVETVFLNGVKREALPAACFMAEAWEDGGIIAFRVVNEHKEPREFWVSCGYAFSSEAQALTHSDIEPIHVREVL